MTSVTTLEQERSHLLAQVKELQSKFSQYTKLEAEYRSYRQETEVKLVTFSELDQDVKRMKAEIEELRASVDRKQKRLAEKEDEIKQLKSR